MSRLDVARSAAERLSRAVEAEGFAGWDPYDALASPALHACARTRLLRAGAIQALRRSPVNGRRLLGVPKQQHTKALALFVAAYARLATLGWGASYRDLALDLAERLVERARPAGDGVGWGYDFDVQTRWGFYRAGQPNAVVTAFAAHALLDASSLAGRGIVPELPRQALDYACSQLLVARGPERYFAYFAGSTTPIHNASLLVASVAARCASRNSEQWRAAEAAVSYSLARQRDDGSWPYGEGRGLGWVDGFHTAYVLDSLACWNEAGGADGDAFVRGLDLYLARLIDSDGAPRATCGSRYPLDIHAAASAVSTLSRLAGYDERAFPTAARVLGWTLRTMYRRDGRFAFRRHRLFRNSTPYVRWGDGHMLLALASFVAAEESRARP